ncbi:MAG: FAD-dependent oxidoreductase [Gemmatimonadota bacterium]
MLGAGPTGLSAAWRLEELGHRSWDLYEAGPVSGGLAASVMDEQGFTWDHGCHVLHSHYAYVDALMEAALGDDWVEHVRETWVWLRQRWIRYPLQNNIWRLPTNDVARCLDGLLVSVLANGNGKSVHTFEDWLRASFGSGIHEIFMEPYNRKVWGYPTEHLGVGWMRDRVAQVDVRRVARNVVLQEDDDGWGPNATFRYPLRGGTGAIWRSLAEQLPAERLHFGSRVVAVHASRRTLVLEDGREVTYDHLICTMPLDRLLSIITDVPELRAFTGQFIRTSTHVVGVGFQGPTPPELRSKSWMYFPELDTPFHRVSVHSNYSPFNVPCPGAQWSLLAEIGESPLKPIDGRTVVEDTLAGFYRCGLVPAGTAIVSRWHRRLEYGYPTPWLGREEVLAPVNDALERLCIFSRGRFGAWKYEVSNQDHSVMQGAEVVERILRGGTEFTFCGDMRDSLLPSSGSRIGPPMLGPRKMRRGV